MLFHRFKLFAFNVALVSACALILAPSLSHRAFGQDLKDDLEALEDFPEEDLSQMSEDEEAAPEATPETAPEAEPDAETDSLEDELGADETEEAKPEEDEAPAEVEDEAASDLEADVKAVEAAPAAGSTLEAATGVALGAESQLLSIQFRQLNDRVRLFVKADAAVDFSRELRMNRKQVIVELRNMRIGKSILKRVLDTTEFEGPVALVQAYEAKTGPVPSVKLLFQLRSMVDPKITRVGNDLYIDFPLSAEGRLFKSGSSVKRPQLPETVLSIDSNSDFKGARISLNLKEAELADVLSLISKASGKNFVLGAPAGSKVTLNVKNLPWDQVLTIILLNQKLGYQKLGTLYRVLPIADLQAEIKSAAEAVKSAEALLPIETRLIPVSYAKAADIKTNITDFKSERGKISIDERTNSLIVTDSADVIEKIITYVRSVDKQTTQVQIEARIVEATQKFSRALNVDWKIGEFNNGSLASSFVNVGGKGSALDFPETGPSFSQLTPAGEQGGVRLRIGSLPSIGAIQALLGIAEQEGTARVIASPRVTVLDNKQATIARGDTITKAGEVSAGGATQTVSVTTQLNLNVTPQVTADGFVLLKVDLQRSTPGAGDLDKIDRSARTEMIVESGKTGVVGGIYQNDVTSTEEGWPLFRNLPIFGVLFKSLQKEASTSNELLMFISPKILNPDRAFLTFRDGDQKDSSGVKTAEAESSPPALDPEAAPSDAGDEGEEGEF